MSASHRSSAQVTETLSLDTMIAVNAMFRRRIVEEDTLINQRMSWMIWSEALLIAAWGASFEVIPPPGLHISSVNVVQVFPVVGIFVGILSFVSIRAAQNEIQYMRDLYKENFAAVKNDPRLPQLTGHAEHHLLGHAVPNLLPWIFILLQLALLLSPWLGSP